MAEGVVLLGLAPFIKTFPALSLGGHAEMTILAVVADADLGCVTTNHLLRVLKVLTLAPLLGRLMR